MQNYDELKDLVNICFVENIDNKSLVRLKRIDKFKGTEKDSSKFFFTQYDTETTEIVNIGLNNMLENV